MILKYRFGTPGFPNNRVWAWFSKDHKQLTPWKNPAPEKPDPVQQRLKQNAD